MLFARHVNAVDIARCPPVDHPTAPTPLPSARTGWSKEIRGSFSRAHRTASQASCIGPSIRLTSGQRRYSTLTGRKPLSMRRLICRFPTSCFVNKTWPPPWNKRASEASAGLETKVHTTLTYRWVWSQLLVVVAYIRLRIAEYRQPDSTQTSQ